MRSKKSKLLFFSSLGGLCILYSLCLALLPTPFFGLRINTTPSVSHHVFIKTPRKKYSRNIYVTLTNSQSNTLLVKRLIGLPGDLIQYVDNHVLVSGIDCGEVKKLSPSGFYLTPIPQGTIPEGYCFVSAPHENSFDSRYAEFGLVPLDNLKEVLWPLF